MRAIIVGGRFSFQSTRPMRGATRVDLLYFSPYQFQSTRPMRGATPRQTAQLRWANRISIHAPHAGRDNDQQHVPPMGQKFQSTRPMRGATPGHSELKGAKEISIHAPHAGRDAISPRNTPVNGNFNPRAPCGARRGPAPVAHCHRHFNPRAPCGARPLLITSRTAQQGISIHAPHAGRDSKSIQNYFTHFCDKRQFLDNFTQNAAF